MAGNSQVDETLSEAVSENVSQQKEETREEMLSRHRYGTMANIQFLLLYA